MREIKFRAWAEKTTKNKWNYAYERTEAIRKKFIRVHDEDEFDRYYWLDKYEKEWDELNPKGNEITKTLGMITDIKVNGSVQRPYGYEVIDVMQYTGLKDKNASQDIYEGDIVDIEGNLTGNVYENNKRETDLVIQGFGTKDWLTTYKKAVDRGCRDAE